ncbi:acyltransferase family protein [Xenorhabdus anantnagensis]|uniref:Acyltransferase family protein n=1 Tax=Xenorhabdus anantnagensis TaxID=3025875 RepID=A0ABT5LX60_9GAMM|nr:acyltransferase family protein [Xenorhabdus anantnagensis]MDC9598311.1 acyltransferase family protein [Xenorhabdus anantnagensis]
MQKSIFRKDINGLRALAVMSVVLFHFNSNYLPGGFAGVDVFFVISGYLMTSIIFKGLEGGNFSILRFFQARVRRIVPALVAVIAIVLFLGYLFFEPLTYQLVGKHGLSSLLFISNIIYANESGYFDADAFSKLFLHTWSLSVEWQFYVVYPIVLVVLSKLISIKKLKLVVLISALASFSFCVYLSSVDETLSYFMLYTRAWEMLIGGLAFLYPINTTKHNKIIIEVAGLSLVISAFFIFSDDSLWPSYNALIPVFGAYLCILANNDKTLLSNAVFQKIGLYSYSIYLVHWPFIVFFKKINVNINLAVYLISIIIIAFVIFNFIEKRRNYKYGLLFIFLISMASSYTISIDGLGFRVDDKYKLTKKEFHREYFGGSAIRQASDIQYFNISDGEKPRAIITGDSFSRQYMNSFKNEKFKAIGIFKDGCFITQNYYSKFDDNDDRLCILRYKNFIHVMNSHPETDVILSMSWGDYKLTNRITGEKLTKNINQAIVNDLAELIKIGGHKRHYYIIGKTNGSETQSFECLARNNLPISKLLKSCPSDNQRKKIMINEDIKKIESSFNNVTFIDPNDALCKNGRCLLLNKNSDPIYSDNSHLSIYGSNIVVKYIMDKIN